MTFAQNAIINLENLRGVLVAQFTDESGCIDKTLEYTNIGKIETFYKPGDDTPVCRLIYRENSVTYYE